MSDVQQLKYQLHQVSTEAKQAAGGLAGFKTKFSQSSAHVQALIAGTPTGTDRDISELLSAAGKSLDHAVQALEIADPSTFRNREGFSSTFPRNHKIHPPIPRLQTARSQRRECRGLLSRRKSSS